MEQNHSPEEETPQFLELAEELMSARPNQRSFALQQITGAYKRSPAALLKGFTPEGNKAPLDEVIQMSDPQKFVDLRPETKE